MGKITKKVERSFQILEKHNAINVEWANLILEDEIEISRAIKNTGFSRQDRAAFLAAVPDGVAYADLAGLVDPEPASSQSDEQSAA